ncbi:MAG: hypothetical protein QM572_12645 [Nocardioides sp.]|uniref:hypothetical protein n=1 Tax=Nocardioides sp. TaxID=35761 RepID=UPI0039E4B949
MSSHRLSRRPLRRLPRLTYANLAATAALVIAVGGTGVPVEAAKAVKKIAANAVGTAQLKANAVTGAKIKDRSITEYDIAYGRLGGNEIKDGSLGGIDVADGSLGGADIADGSLGGADIADGSLGGDDIAPRSVSGQKLVEGSVGSYELTDNSISSADIANDTITNDDIKDGALAATKLAPDAFWTLSRYVSGEPIVAESTISGYEDSAYKADGTDDVRAVSVSFPAWISGAVSPTIVSAGGGGVCGGTFGDPAAPAGRLCVYVASGATNLADGGLVVRNTSSRGFSLTHTPAAAGLTEVQLTWAYTAS